MHHQFWRFCTTRAPVAQLDRVPGYEPGGREFESLRARHSYKNISLRHSGKRIAADAASFRRRSRRLCPATPDAYFNWIPAALNCSSFPPKAKMTNMSGENDGCLYFHHCSALASCPAALEYNWPAIPGDNSSFLSSPASGTDHCPRRRHPRSKRNKNPHSVILAGRRESRWQ